jgi:hypothetical protein
VAQGRGDRVAIVADVDAGRAQQVAQEKRLRTGVLFQAPESNLQSTIRNPKSARRQRLHSPAHRRRAHGSVPHQLDAKEELIAFEAFGRDGYLRVDGLGSSYGLERPEVG